MKKINVYFNKGNTQNQDKSFDSIVWLHKKGYTEKGVIISSDAENVQTPTYEFVKSKPSSDVNENSTIRMDKQNGATWFSALRGERRDNDTAIWQMFIEKVADYFHKEYSLLEYAPISQVMTNEKVEIDKQRIKRVISFFAEKLNNAEVVIDNKGSQTDDIYGATLRLTISDGTGEAKPVLCRIFFRNKDDEKGIEPVINKDIGAINASIKSFGDDTLEEINSDNFSSNETVSSIMNALDELLNREEGFQDFVNFEDERDKEVIEAIISRGPDNNAHIFCRSVDVIGVFHVKWSIRAYKVTLQGKKIFSAKVGVGDKISINCKLCSEIRKLVDNNKIKIAPNKSIVIYPEHDNLGLDEENLKILKENNPFDGHAIEVACEHSRFNEGYCKRYVCKTNLFEVNQELYGKKTPSEIKKTILCKDCPNIETVYKIEEEYFHTPQLIFCHDKMALTKKENVHYCKVCDRAYSDDLGKKSICEFCKSVVEKTNDKHSVALYKKYAEMLPFSQRILGLAKGKRCNEDADIIIFGIGDRILLFNKNFEDSKKYIEAYKKYKVKKG